MAGLLPLLLALARTVPAFDSLVTALVAERNKDREREAAMRLQRKDAEVDRAIDAPLPSRLRKPTS